MAEISWPWQYNFPPFFTEGNAHIVIQLIGTNYVLRLIKEDVKPILVEEIKILIKFVNLVMIPLSKNYNYGTAEIVDISDCDLDELSKELQKYRPVKRLNKSTLRPVAIKTVNLSILSPECKDNYCIEIKPKEGFIPSSLKVYSKCYYCLKQYLKMNDQDIQEPSAYCPLDLFSGDKDRMRFALHSMMKNPQNNFKFFKNGKFIDYPMLWGNNEENQEICTHLKSSELLVDFIIEVLLGNASVFSKKDNISKEHEDIIPLESVPKLCNDYNNLKPNSFLYDLLQLQKLSEAVAVEDFAMSIEDISKQHYSYTAKVLNQLETMSLNLNIQSDRETFLNTTDPLHLALISAVMRDCSIMISFSTSYVENVPFVDIHYINNEMIRMYYKLTLTDLEPKPISTLFKRRCTEKRMIDIYEQQFKYLNKKLDSKIQPHSETRAKQLEAWQTLITDYLKSTKQSTIDIRESQNSPLFNNAEIARKLSQEAILTILEDMAKNGRAAPIDKNKNLWEIYWHSLDEWGNMVYNWACNNGMNNSVCTLFELREGDNTIDEEFHGLDMNVLLKALKTLELKGRCELMEFDDSQGVKFF